MSTGLQDARHRVRLAKMTAKIETAPGLSFPQLFQVPSELEACYRFLSNVHVTPEAILAPHFAEVARLSVEEDDVLVLHDTTDFSFGGDVPREGLGRIRAKHNAFFAHVSLAVSMNGHRLPLGVAALHTWARQDEAIDEHARWFGGVTLSRAHIPSGKAIHVMDREGDDYCLFWKLVECGERFVIRSNHDRLLEHDEFAKLKEATLNLERQVQRKAHISARSDAGKQKRQRQQHPARNSRTVELSIGATTVDLKRPKVHPRDKDKPRPDNLPPSLRMNVVRVWEPHPPEGEEPVEWHLLTSEHISSTEDLERVVDIYRARWTIEEYFKALKSGCAMEKRQLEDYESLCNALAIFVPVACRALALRSAAQELQPATHAQTVFTQEEVNVLRALKPKLVPQQPTTRDLLLAVASMGGHIKWNGDPGWQTLMRGMREFLSVMIGFGVAKLQYGRDQ